VLKLGHLFDNRDLAGMLLADWAHDDPADQLFGSFRISSNATYPFRRSGKTCFLRFSPVDEKQPEAVLAELEFIRFLRGHGYGAPKTIPSLSGEELLVRETPWGAFSVAAFEHAGGTSLEEVDLRDEVLVACGRALGALHRLSGRYEPRLRRWTHGDVLGWMASTLEAMPHQERALAELALLRSHLAALPVNADDYGLVHYDFESDNVFVEPSTLACSVIDFDDAMYHWYAMDLEQTLDSLGHLVGQAALPRARRLILDGYGREVQLNDEMLRQLPAFRRFADLYCYTRIARSVQETWEHEPDWLQLLRVKLSVALETRSERFGTPLE
jgi:Ser/Thr protein kinase RdoA (MazF antagonist)